MLRTLLVLPFLAVIPSSSNFILKTHEIGSGAGASTSTNYRLSPTVGQGGGTLGSSSYQLPAGVQATQSLSAPAAPLVANPDDSYNRLHVTLQTTGAPSDLRYLVAVSKDNFASTQYVQLDLTIAPLSTIAQYQSYAAWGGAGGFWILGLDAGTNYQVRVATLQGANSGSPFGPSSAAATAVPQATFSISTSASASPPFSTTFGSLTPGQVINGNEAILAAVTTNAKYGGSLAIQSQNGGLLSITSGTSITSLSGDLGALSKGYGAQLTGTSQVSGGPLTALAPFNGSNEAIAALTNARQAFATFPGPVSNGTATLQLKAKADIASIAEQYTDLLTLTLSLLF